MRLLKSLFILSAATAVPILGFALLAGGYVVREERENLVSAAQSRNRATLAAIDAELRGAMGTLQAMSSAVSLADGDLQAFHRYAQTLLSTQPSWNNLVLADRGGHQLVNARLPWGTKLLAEVVDKSSFDATLATRQPSVGGLSFAPLLRSEPGIAVRVPIIREGDVPYVLTAVLSTRAFQRLLSTQGLPKGWTTGIVDSHGLLVARVPPVEPGTTASVDYLRRTRTDLEGWYRGKTLEGTDTFTAFSTSALTGWSVGYALPTEAVLGGATRAAWLTASGIALSVVAATFIAIGLSRRIAGPLQQLANAAVTLTENAEQPVVKSNVDEVHLLSAEFSEARRRLHARDLALQRSTDALLQQAADLRQADANKSRFLALLAHELRNPLAPLRSGLAVLMRTGAIAGQKELGLMMGRQIAHMSRLIDDLLDVSRIDRGVMELRHESLLLNMVVANAVEAAGPGMEEKQQRLEIRLAPGDAHIHGDSVRLTQVVSNILHNASKFSPHQGTIEIRTQCLGEKAILTVKDSGAGFRPEDADRIFELFVRLDGDKSQLRSGLGIGLTIVKSIVDMHGGRVTAYSDGLGKGATFEVRLPLASSEVAQVPTDEPISKPGMTQRKVMVVDDNVDGAEMMAEMLRLDGFEVRVAFDGAQGLKLAREWEPEVAFLDIQMPGMGGAELATALRTEPWAASLRLVALTGFGQPSDIEASMQAGFDAHLTKPAPPEEIVRLAAEL